MFCATLPHDACRLLTERASRCNHRFTQFIIDAATGKTPDTEAAAKAVEKAEAEAKAASEARAAAEAKAAEAKAAALAKAAAEARATAEAKAGQKEQDRQIAKLEKWCHDQFGAINRRMGTMEQTAGQVQSQMYTMTQQSELAAIERRNDTSTSWSSSWPRVEGAAHQCSRRR